MEIGLGAGQAVTRVSMPRTFRYRDFYTCYHAQEYSKLEMIFRQLVFLREPSHLGGFAIMILWVYLVCGGAQNRSFVHR